MGIGETFPERYKAYLKEEQELEDTIVEQFELKMKWLTSVLFIMHFALILWLGAALGGLIYPLEKDHIGFTFYCAFGGIGYCVWVVVGLWGWLHGFEFTMSDPWVESASEACSKIYARSRKIRKLEGETQKRKEFFQFYELFQTDETFREAYLAQVSKKAEADEFLNRLNR